MQLCHENATLVCSVCQFVCLRWAPLPLPRSSGAGHCNIGHDLTHVHTYGDNGLPHPSLPSKRAIHFISSFTVHAHGTPHATDRTQITPDADDRSSASPLCATATAATPNGIELPPLT